MPNPHLFSSKNGQESFSSPNAKERCFYLDKTHYTFDHGASFRFIFLIPYLYQISIHYVKYLFH